MIPHDRNPEAFPLFPKEQVQYITFVTRFLLPEITPKLADGRSLLSSRLIAAWKRAQPDDYRSFLPFAYDPEGQLCARRIARDLSGEVAAVRDSVSVDGEDGVVCPQVCSRTRLDHFCNKGTPRRR